ncbi:unnamed protein product [Peronospora belbahrii]|uniref:HEAT repeat-containing protein 1 n=1 Tax=Peronospora belbahrii TaxID=622444 RepID=A0AAU9L0P4_9STRA|nr:unnamed protein product [Peronospora belbahrii]CAH0514100.1 unnamed protein product [Peronospora belbahrii]
MTQDGLWLNTLVHKLRHPLGKIRSRALHNLLLKLRECLVQYQDLEPLEKSLIPSLLACLEPPFELETLHVLELLVESKSEVFLASLQHHGAAPKLQQAARKNPELQATYEKLLRQMYTTKLVSMEEKKKTDEMSQVENKNEKNMARQEDLGASRVLSTTRKMPSTIDELETRGWKFAHVMLTSVDDQYLFEFEVKLYLRTEIQEIVTACATFRNELLRNFPAEVFLQRPAILQYLLHLVQQPILSERFETTSKTQRDDGEVMMMVKAMQVSMGVNYFDEMIHSTFSSKRGNLTGAVAMASLKAIESFLYALQLTRRLCHDPTYVVYSPHVHVNLFDSYDSRRMRYPPARAEIEVNTNRRGSGECGGQFEHYSLSGAVYRVFISILPLLRSARHPRLHILNLLIVALPDLPEKSYLTSADTSVQKLNRLRLERIFEILSGICRPVSPERAGSNIMDDELELTHCMTWKLVELVLKLLQLYPSSQYCVEKTSSKPDCNSRSGIADDSGAITVPRVLWDAVKLWTASPLFSEVSSIEWKDEAVVQLLAQIDSTIPSFVDLKHSSQRDAKSILCFVEFAKLHREQLVNFSSLKKPDVVTLEVARKAVQARCVFNSADTEIIADAALQTVWSALSEDAKDKTGKIIESDVENIQLILSDMVREMGEMETPALHDSMVIRFFRGFANLVEKLNDGDNRISADCRDQFVTEVICESEFIALLLLAHAKQVGNTVDKMNDAAFWKILRITLNHLASFSNEKLVVLQPVVALLQHFAYLELSEESSQEQRLAQLQLAKVLNRLEISVSDHTRKVLLCRYLLHQSSYIRKAASSKLIRLLSRTIPSYVGSLSKDKAICEDPFGSTTCVGQNLQFEAALMETPLPTFHVGHCQPSENELSSQLNKLAHLCKVISSTSSAFESMRKVALKELAMFIDHLSVELFALLEEMNKLSGLFDLLSSLFRQEQNRRDSSMVQHALILIRTLLLRSRLLRLAIQYDSDMMELLMALIFHASVLVRAQMYYIILLLTCSAENFIPSGEPAELLSDDKVVLSGEARIPEMVKTTFGLYSGCWTRCLIDTCSLEQQWRVSCALLTKRADSSWLQEVRAVVTQTPYDSDEDDVKNDARRKAFSILLDAEYAIVAQKLRDAPSHGKCLNALYHLMTMCEAWHFGRDHFVGEWEAYFERYFAVPPKSERDEVIIGSLVASLSVMFCVMTRNEQLRALIVVKRKVFPLLKRSHSKAFSLQVARLLLNVSKSKVGDLFLSLAADTDIVTTICTKYLALYTTEPVLHGLMLEVLLRFARGMDQDTNTHLSAPSRDKICKRLLEMISPLLTVVCRHRVPGSYLERDVFVVGSQCMITILRLLPPNFLLSSDCYLEHTDSSILLDCSWVFRYLFDHVSPIRELGFLVIEYASSSKPPATRLLEMIFGTFADDTESDAVRAAACSALTNEIILYHERSSDQQAAMVEIFHGTTFSGRVFRLLTCALKGNKLLARASNAFARLVRVLYVHRDRVAPIFGDVQKELDAAEKEVEVYQLFVQALSLREWKYKCDRYCSIHMHLPSCNATTWRHSLLPAILDMMSEMLNLFQAICRDTDFNQVAFFLTHTTLQFQAMELIRDVSASLDSSLSTATKQKHYKVLDLCAGTLSSLFVQAFDQCEKYKSKQLRPPTTPPSFETELVGVVVKLLGSHHPIDFRVSFSRIVPTISFLIPGLLESSDPLLANALASVVLDLYREVAGPRHLDANTTVAASQELQSRIFPLAFIRRVSSALQVLLESSLGLQQHIQVRRALPFAMASTKELFSAIQIAGGFSGKRDGSSNGSLNTSDAYVLDLCRRIQAHIEVMSAIVGGDKESQQLAKAEGLVSVLLSNWSVMKVSHVCGSQLMLRALRLLANYTYGNDNTRRSLLISLLPASAKISKNENARTLLSLVFDLASSRGKMTSSHCQVARGATTASTANIAVSNAACQVVKAVLLNTECVLASVKTGSIYKLIHSLQDRLKRNRQTSKTNHLEAGNLAHMLGVLSSVASNEEGARVLYTSWANMLSLLFDDVMHLSDEAIQRSGCLFLRNLSFSQLAKNYFAMWEKLLDDMIALCVRVTSAPQGDLTIVAYLSAALWSLVYDNQKARALLLSRHASLQHLQQVLGSQNAASQQTNSQDITENLRRVLMLVKE